MPTTTIVNGLDVNQLAGTVDAVTATPPALARFQFRAHHEWFDGTYSRTTIRDFYGVGHEDTSRTVSFSIDADEPPVLLGENRAPNASEYVLHALAACLTGTIVLHAAAHGIALKGLEATIHGGDLDAQGVLGISQSVRPGYERINATITVTGDFDDDQLAELDSFIRYSPVRDLITNPVPLAIDLARA